MMKDSNRKLNQSVDCSTTMMTARGSQNQNQTIDENDTSLYVQTERDQDSVDYFGVSPGREALKSNRYGSMTNKIYTFEMQLRNKYDD